MCRQIPQFANRALVVESQKPRPCLLGTKLHRRCSVGPASAPPVLDEFDISCGKMSLLRFDEELLYLPNENLLNHFTAGLSSVVADLLWLRTIHYTVKEFHDVDRKFHELVNGLKIPQDHVRKQRLTQLYKYLCMPTFVVNEDVYKMCAS